MHVRPSLEALEGRLVPAAFTWHGGPILSAPLVANLFVGGYRADLDRMASVVTSPGYTSRLTAYGIGPGRWDGTEVLPSLGPLSDHQIQVGIYHQILLGNLPRPTPGQCYMVYPDAPVTNGFGTYHSSFTYGGLSVAYGVAPLTDPVGSAGPSHEIAEMMTDPYLTGWYAGSPYGGEVCDLTGGRTFTLDGLQVAEPFRA